MATIDVSTGPVTITPPGGDVTLTIPSGAQGETGPAGNAEKSGCIMLSGSESGSTALTTGDSKAVIRLASEFNGMDLTAVGASCMAPGSTSGIVTIQIRRVRSGSGVDMLSTPITLDAGETDTLTAATAAVIDTSNDDVQTGDQIHFDVDTAGAGVLGLAVTFTFQTP